MKRKRFLAVACAAAMIASMTTGLAVNVSAADEKSDFAGEELSILVSAGWMDNRYDETIKRFEDTYDVTVDLQTIPADQYSDLLQSKLATDSCADIFWIQSNPFAIESTIVDPEKYCIDFTGASWENVMPETRKESCVYNDKLYGLQIWNASPEYVMVYNKTLFEENGWEVPTTYDELKELCGKIQDAGITPWFMPGADGWQHQLAFFQIGGVYEEATPGLYDELNENKATFADNEKMLEVLNEFKELSDAGYFGEDWIGTDSTNMSNEFGDRNCAMALANSSFIKQIQELKTTIDNSGDLFDEIKLQIERSKREREELNKRHKSFFEKREEISKHMTDLDKEVYRLESQREGYEEASEKQINYMWEEYELTLNHAKELRNPNLTDLADPGVKR